LALFLGAELEDVITTQRVVGCDTKTYRGVDLSEFRDYQYVVEITQPGTTILLWEDDPEES
jgi:hypothetical protein